jgi:hypothetical protein
MKKIFYTASVLATLSVTLFTGCKKDTVAFPDKAQSNGTYSDLAYITPYFPAIADADGILIAAQVTNQKTVIISPYINIYEYGMAKFTNSTGNFASLADAGSITVNDSNLVKSSALSYLSSTSTYSLNFSNSAAWNIGGNGSFQGTTYTLTGANPTYSNSFANWDSKWTPIYPKPLYVVPARPIKSNYTGASGSPGDTIQFKADYSTYITDSVTHYKDSVYNATNQYSIAIKNYTSNADTVIIAMVDGSGFSYIRKAPATDSLAYFKPNDFLGYSSYDISTFKLQFNAIKYNSTMVGAKKYYFLKMASYIKYYQATK